MDNELNNREEQLFEKLLQHLEDGNTEAIREDAELREALRQLHDTECAFRCGRSPRVNVEQELQLTLGRLSSQEPDIAKLRRRGRRRVLYGMLGGIGVGVAATLLLLLSFGYFNVKHDAVQPDGEIVLYSAISNPSEVLFGHREKSDVAEDAGDAFVSKSVSAVADSGAAVEVLDMRLRKAVASEECIVTTPVGKTMEVILADGTNVLLSPESSLRFPARFSGDRRSVNLEGEAYFDVAKDADHPFVVVSQDYCTIALGTEFDVRAYSRADLKVSLIEGSVQVENLVDRSSVILNPGEDVTSVNGKLVVSSVDMKAFEYWRDGYFYFDDTPLADMMLELGRWYNVNVVLNSRSLMSYRLHFVSGRNEDIGEVVKRLNKFSYLDVKLVDDKIVIDECR
ncbi:MAG: FecR domain-containing protein [Bacteroides sp.]|nr:FecR domain-containing protein [Bacteroides sp.]MCM1391008.1 FecR domain-containing protein [Bacteroides sp.]